MRVRKWVDFGQDVEVDIGMDDIRAALAECFENVTRDRLGEEGPTVSEVARAFESIAKFLKAMTEEQIAKLNEMQRKTICDFLKEQAARYERSRVSQVTASTTEG